MKINVAVSLLVTILVVSGLLGFAGVSIREAKAADPVKILVGGPATAGTWSGWRGNRTGPVTSPPSTVRYTVNITGVIELWSFDFTLAWGMTVFDLKARTSRIGASDGILNSPNFKVVETSLNEANRTAVYRLAYTQSGAALPWNYTSGKGCIVYLDFMILSPGGECDVYFVDSKLSFKNGTSISHTREDGYFYLPTKKRVPTASFTISPTMKVANRTSVSFNGGASSDPDGAGIKSYIWTFGQDKPKIPAIQSPHPYPTSANLLYSLTQTGAIRMRVYFPNITTESGDYVYVRDKNNVLVSQYTGSFLNVWSNWAKGDTLNINLVGDGDTGVGWGFIADHYGFFLQVTTATTTYTYTILESDYAASPYGPYPFTTSLSVVDNEDSQSKTVFSDIQVVHPRPVARFTMSPNVTHYYPIINWAYIFCGKTVNFDASGSYDPDGLPIASYQWDFGDGTKQTKTTPTTSYSFSKRGGEMLVGLTVVDAEGLQSFWSYKIYAYNMTEFARTYGYASGDSNFNYFYDINQNLIVTAADLYIMGRSYY